MVSRIFMATLGFFLIAGPAAAEFVPLTMMQNDIQKALGRLDPHVKPVKPKKAAGDATAPDKAAAANKDDDKGLPAKVAKTEPAKPEASAAVPIPRLRPAAAPETAAAAAAVGGYTAAPAFSEADEPSGVGGYLPVTAGDGAKPAAIAGEPDGPALAYAPPQPPIPRVNPRALAVIADIPPGDKPLKGKPPVRVASLPPGNDVDSGDEAAKTGMARLNALGVSAKELAPIEESACSVADPVLIASLDGGAIPLSGVAKVNQAVATTFAVWVRETVEPAAKSILGAEVTGLRIADSYSCRTRDHIQGAKLSEHAFGNAIDVGAFRIGNEWLTVGGSHSGDQQAFLDKVRAAACGPFKTVLGPGSDGYHTDHFHLDLAKRKTGGPSRGLYCH